MLALAAGMVPTLLPAQTEEVELARRIADVASLAVAEYGSGVVAGKVVRDEELQEARLFLAEARRLAEGLAPGKRDVVLPHLERLTAGVAALGTESALQESLAVMRADLASAVGAQLEAYPAAAPSLVRGELLFGRYCAGCHGEGGAGNGAEASRLDPPPSDLTDRSRLRSVPLEEMLRKVSVGVAGTAMPAFGDRLDVPERWAVTLYAAGLRYRAGDVDRGARQLVSCRSCAVVVSDLARTAPLSDDSLALLLAGMLDQDLDSAAATAATAFARVAAAREYLGADRELAALRVTERTAVLLDRAVVSAAAGAFDEATQLALDAYLTFEGIETAVRARNGGAAREVEHAFTRFRGTLRPAVTAADRQAASNEVHASMRSAVEMLAERASVPALLGQSLVILVREGLEAILIVGALGAFLVRVGASERKSDLALGVGAAVLASVATAGLLVAGFRAAATHQEVLEGLTMVAAALVLFWVSYWLVSKIEMRRWQEFVRTRMLTALRSRRSRALAGVAFLAVYREGFETVLFYAALVTSTDGGAASLAAVTGGIGVGAFVLALVYYAMQRWGVRLPLKPFFGVTSALLYCMAFSFAGQGVAALQAAGIVPATPLAWLPAVPALGIFPTFQTFVSQLVLALALVGALTWVFWLEPRAGVVKAAS
ncbi:MAG: FTR1 family protein [Gemmatimonadales bacterium]|nr:FTR1 family protein [Gemmatimonadales bacterium]